MKVTSIGRTHPVTGLETIGGSGSAGEVPTATGSNGGIVFGPNVAVITVNGTTTVLGPRVNFANGSNTTVTVDQFPGSTASNTIRIHATGGAASFGSNSTRVSEIPSGGASSDSSRADHIHDGIGTITASSSNTLQRGTVNLRAGNNISFGLTDTDGDGELDTVTVHGAAAGGGGSPGGAGLAQSFVGYNTIGGTWTAVAGFRVYCKSITLAADSLITSIDAHVRGNSDNFTGFYAAVMTDNAGAPGVLLGGAGNNDPNVYFSNSGSMPTAGRWFATPIGIWLTAGTYWIAISSPEAVLDIANDGSGSDQTFNPGSFQGITGAYPSAWALSNSGRTYSIRASILS